MKKVLIALFILGLAATWCFAEGVPTVGNKEGQTNVQPNKNKKQHNKNRKHQRGAASNRQNKHKKNKDQGNTPPVTGNRY
jgi:hypothetical protein